MPIVSSQHDYVRLQRNGRYRCRDSYVDSRGRVWTAGPYWADSVAAADAKLAGRDMASQLLSGEGQEAADVMAAGGDPENDPPLTEHTNLTQRRRALARAFAREDDKDRAVRMALYINQFTQLQIQNALGTTPIIAAKIKTRASTLAQFANDLLNDETIEDLEG